MYQHWLLKWINKTLQTLPSLPAPCKGGRPWCDDSWLTCILKKIQKCKPFPTHLIHFCRKKTIQKMEYKKMREKVVQPFRKKLNFICFVSTDFFSLSGSSPSPLQVAHCPLANARNRSRYRSSRSRHNPPRKFGEVWWVPHGGNITWRSQAKKEVTVPCTIFSLTGHNIIPSWSYCGFIHLRWWIGATDRSSGQALVPSFLKMIWTTSVLCLCALAGKRCQYHKKTERR